MNLFLFEEKKYFVFKIFRFCVFESTNFNIYEVTIGITEYKSYTINLFFRTRGSIKMKLCQILEQLMTTIFILVLVLL